MSAGGKLPLCLSRPKPGRVAAASQQVPVLKQAEMSAGGKPPLCLSRPKPGTVAATSQQVPDKTGNVNWRQAAAADRHHLFLRQAKSADQQSAGSDSAHVSCFPAGNVPSPHQGRRTSSTYLRVHL
ncbi:hypothetical protein V1264_021910 [Littorina saxatilis]|uniref:Uncharacterized protein n=1 Tax=Littorina saxatilis TaxID=31220 RepID=A0AAN9AJD2_9CAEN